MDCAHGGHTKLDGGPELGGAETADIGGALVGTAAALGNTWPPPTDAFGSAATEEMTPFTERNLVRFNALRNALYHTARRRTLERWSRLFNFAVVVLGATAVGDFLKDYGQSQQFVGLAVAIIGAMQLVFDFGRQARDHQGLQREYYKLLADIDAAIEPTLENCAEWQSRIILITAEEPPTLKAVDAKAYNDAIDSSGTFDQGQRLVIPLHHRLFGDFFWL